MAKKYTGFENVRITGELVVEGGVKVPGIDDVSDAAKAADTAPTKAEFDALVDEVAALKALLGG